MLLIGAKENKCIATADVVGDYLIAETKDHVVVILTGEAVDIICNDNNKYKGFISYENGKKVLYMRLLKALYGCMQSALFWYQTFKECLE